jgi:hypothetical protein
VEGNKLEFFLDGCVDKPIEFVCTKIVNAGYTGKNQAEVRKHIEELKALGVPAPDSVPTYYPKACDLLTYADSFEVADTDNSGEAEYVILVAEDDIYIAAGSDHTDRNLEVTSVITKAKQMCPNVLSRAVWRLSDVEDHWDDIAIRSWIDGNPDVAYQEATLGAMLNPREILERVKPLVDGDLVGTAIYSGTVATIGEIHFSNKFEMSLTDAVRGQTLYCGYSVHPFPWFKNPA